MDNQIIIGIDLGTTKSIASIWRNHSLEIISDNAGRKAIPSIVAFDNKGILTGYDAKVQIEKNPKNTIYDVKRLIGRKFSDKIVQDDIDYYTYKITGNDNDDIIINTEYGNKKTYLPSEISAKILSKIKNIAQTYLNNPVTKAVITIPAYFNDSQRQATKDAALIAGLDCVRMINEPTAVALAYGLTHREKPLNVIVYDFGGGTLDVSMLNIDDGIIQVIATTGNTHLGGEDFDKIIQEYLLEKFIENNSDIEINSKYYENSLQKLRSISEKAKILLSTKMEVILNIKDFYVDTKNNIILDLNCILTKDIFEKISEDLFIEALKPIDDIMYMTDSNTSDIDEIILVGGSIKIPKIQFIIHNYFNKPPCMTVDPINAVAAGAALQAYMLSNSDDPFCDGLTLLDVIPLSLGIETFDGKMVTIIPRNTPIPTTKNKKFTTETDNQDEVTIKIYEGERPFVKDNYHIATFTLENIENEKKGIPVIIITFRVDINGIISVEAYDKKKNISKMITISDNKIKLSKDEIDKLIIEAKNNEFEDDLKQKIVDLYYEYKFLYDMIYFNINLNIANKLIVEDKNEMNKNLLKYDEIIENIIKKYKKSLCLFKNSKEQDEQKEILEYDFNNTQDERCNDYQNITKELYNKIRILKKKYEQFVMQFTTTETETPNTIKSANIYNDQQTDINDEQQEIVSIETENLSKYFTNPIDNIKLNEDDPNMQERKDVYLTGNRVLKYIDINKNSIISNNYNNISEYIKNIFIWMDVTKHITIDEYKNKNNEINLIVNKILKDNKDEMNENNSARGILNKKCMMILDEIDAKNIPMSTIQLLKLKQYIINILKWFDENKEQYHRNDSRYSEKISELNIFYDKLINNEYDDIINE